MVKQESNAGYAGEPLDGVDSGGYANESGGYDETNQNY